MLETLTYVDENGLKCPLRCRRKDGDVWFHLRDVRSCLGVQNQTIMFEAVNVRSFNEETHINARAMKHLFKVCSEFEPSKHFINWFNGNSIDKQADTN